MLPVLEDWAKGLPYQKLIRPLSHIAVDATEGRGQAFVAAVGASLMLPFLED